MSLRDTLNPKKLRHSIMPNMTLGYRKNNLSRGAAILEWMEKAKDDASRLHKEAGYGSANFVLKTPCTVCQLTVHEAARTWRRCHVWTSTCDRRA